MIKDEDIWPLRAVNYEPMSFQYLRSRERGVGLYIRRNLETLEYEAVYVRTSQRYAPVVEHCKLDVPQRHMCSAFDGITPR